MSRVEKFEVNRAATRKVNGFTLVELMVTLVLAAVLLTLAVPGFFQLIQRNQVAALTNEFSSALSNARATARARNTCVTICRTTDASAAAPACNTGGSNWNMGWIVFTNPGCVATLNTPPANGDYLEMRIGQARANIDDTAPSIMGGNLATQRRIMFDHRGMLALNSAQIFSIAPAGGISTRQICLAMSGRAVVADDGGCTN